MEVEAPRDDQQRAGEQKDNVKRRWRVKVYRLDNESRWIDEGTGMVEIKYLRRINGNAIQVTADHENETPGKIILESAIVAEDIYQPQGKMIITWSEPTSNMELAISFEEQQGCEYILDQLCQIQGRVSGDFHGGPRGAPNEYGYRTMMRDGEVESGESSFQDSMERLELPDPDIENLEGIADLVMSMSPLVRETYLNAILSPFTPKDKSKARRKRRRAGGSARKRPRALSSDAQGSISGSSSDTKAKNQHGSNYALESSGETKSDGNGITSENAVKNNHLQQANTTTDSDAAVRDTKDDKDGHCSGSTGSGSSSGTTTGSLEAIDRRGEHANGGTPSLDDEASSGDDHEDPERYTYLQALLDTFHECESKGDLRSLHTLFIIVRTLVLFNEPVFLEELLSDTYFEDIVGVLEYDPEVKPKPNHREFLRKHVQHKMVVPIEDPETLRKVHQSFRIRFFRDAVMPRTLDEATAGIITDMDAMNGIQIASALHVDPHYLHNIFDLLRSESTPVDKRNDAVGLLQELCSLAKKMQVPQRNAFYRSLMKKGENFFGIFERILGDPNSTVQERLNIGDILKLALDHDPTQLRSFILMEKSQPQSPRVRAIEVMNRLIEDPHTPVRVKLQRQMDLFAQPETPRNGEERPPLSLMAQLLKRLVFDPEAGMQAQAMEILKMLLDPETMEAAEKESFLTLFYDHYIAWLVLPLEMVRIKQSSVNGGVSGASPVLSSSSASSSSSSSSLSAVSSTAATVSSIPSGITPSAPHTSINTTLYPPSSANLPSGTAPPAGMPGNEALTTAPPGYQLVMCSGLLDAHTTSGPRSAEDRQLERKAAETARVAEHHITDLLSFCVQTHGFRIKYFVLNKDIISKVLRLLHSRDKHLVLSAIRFARTCVGLKDDFYNRHIVKLNLFSSIFDIFVSNGPRNNLINSAIIELLEFVRMEKIRLLIKYIVETFGDKLNSIDYVDTYTRLKEAYEQNKTDGGNDGSAHARFQHQRHGRSSLLGMSEVGNGANAPNALSGTGSVEFDFRPFGEHGRQLPQDEEDYFQQRPQDTPESSIDNAAEQQPEQQSAPAGADAQDQSADSTSSFRRMHRGLVPYTEDEGEVDDEIEDYDDDDDENNASGSMAARKNKRKAKSLRVVVDTKTLPPASSSASDAVRTMKEQTVPPKNAAEEGNVPPGPTIEETGRGDIPDSSAVSSASRELGPESWLVTSDDVPPQKNSFATAGTVGAADATKLLSGSEADDASSKKARID